MPKKIQLLFFFIAFSLFLPAQLLICPQGLTNAGTELISNGNFSGGNVDFSSSYTYDPATAYLGGSYTVGTSAFAANANFVNLSDHTTGTGNMMIVNGSGTPNTSVWCQTITVAPNTIYSFSAWVASVSNISLASLQFQVNGVNLGTPFNAPITFFGWQQFAATWTSGAATSATICIINQNTQVNGNDFALDDISFQACVCNQMNLAATIQDATCASSTNGSVSVAVSGGVGPFSYSWNTAPPALVNNINTLGTGTYTFYVLDTGAPAASSCDTTVTYTIATLPPIQPTVTHTDVGCAGGQNGTATASATGGSGNYTYSWATTPPQLTANATGLGLGTYTVYVADATDANCKQSANVTIQQGTAISLTTSTTAASCATAADGSVSVQASGGSGNYTYSWVLTPPQLTASANNLLPGTYTVFVADASDPTNCFTSISATVQAGSFSLNLQMASPKDVSCFGGTDGSAQVQASGGSGNYTYSWATTPPQFTATANNLAVGNYTVYVTDAAGSPLCMQSNSVNVVLGQGMTLIATVLNNAKCQGSQDGKAKVVVTGGSGNYSYSWTSIPSQNTAIATNLGAGTYFVYVSDANAPGCLPSASVSITEPSALQIIATNTVDATCFGQKDGTANVVVTGGTNPYTYIWSAGGQNTQTATGLGAGNYNVTVKDSNNCTITSTLAINQPVPISIALQEKTDASCSLANGAITVVATNGTLPFSYSWESLPPVLSATIQNIPSGTYKVWAKDNKGCEASANFSISNTLPTTAFFTCTPIDTEQVLLSKAVFKFKNLSVDAKVYEWTFGDAYSSNLKNPTHTYYETGDFNVTLISDNGYNLCPDTFSLMVHVIPDGAVYVPNAFSPNADGANDVFFVGGEGMEEFDMRIFDRWGNLVAHFTNPKDKWDGTIKGNLAPEGVYVYSLGVKLNNGQREDRSGTITLIR